MTTYESKSDTGQDRPPPSKEEREAALSSDGAGRKAIERVKPPLPEHPPAEEKEAIEPPVGLDLETRHDDHKSHAFDKPSKK